MTRATAIGLKCVHLGGWIAALALMTDLLMGFDRRIAPDMP
jgi:hypothetical protein